MAPGAPLAPSRVHVYLMPIILISLYANTSACAIYPTNNRNNGNNDGGNDDKLLTAQMGGGAGGDEGGGEGLWVASTDQRAAQG